MSRAFGNRDYHGKGQQQGNPARAARRRNSAVANGRSRDRRPRSRRGVVKGDASLPFSPPEDWHEPQGSPDGYRIIVQAPGEGFRHACTPEDVRKRLAQLPAHFLRDLEFVQFSRITRKKQSLPCYGMQWGATLYLYPVDDSLVEHFVSPPPPAVVNEARMYGGVWSEEGDGRWTLTWTEETLRDFYLNNILIHELGHLLDERNTGYTDRERFAEWFATEYGYRQTGGAESRRPKQRVVRRHHAGG
jgi:hypothetical protein